ncbi:MAG: acetylglutamate kinase [Victivallales bacterium]|nr:acetylglutamate kinase [Victivallales bacterium]
MIIDELIEKASTLLEALPYIQRFKDAIVVIKLGGSTMEDPALTESTMRDIVLLEAIGIHPVVVHGGGKAITTHLKALKIETKFVFGLRYTCDKTLKVVDEVLHHVINRELVEWLNRNGGHGVTLSGKEVLRATRMYSTNPENGEQIDVGFVGNIVSVDEEKIIETIEKGAIPVITPLGTDENGQIYNINADVAACKVAEFLKARKLVFLSDVPGILRDPQDEKSLIPSIRVDEVEALIADKTISGGMIPKIKSSVHALRAGSNKVHMIDGRIQHSLLLEIFTDKGIGTEIVKH